MNRRSFARTLAGTVVGAYGLGHTSDLLGEEPTFETNEADVSAVPFKLSVMLWTVFPNLTFEERLEKVADAGYHNVELVGEYEKWTDADFERANARRKASWHQLRLHRWLETRGERPRPSAAFAR